MKMQKSDTKRGAAHNICNFKYSAPKKIPIGLHNGSKYDYHFIIKGSEKNLKNNLIVWGKILKNT